MVGPRYNKKKDEVKFVSKSLASRQANENRVFQYAYATMYVTLLIEAWFIIISALSNSDYSKRLAARFAAERTAASSVHAKRPTSWSVFMCS